MAGILLIFAVNSFLVSQEAAVQNANTEEQSLSGTPLFTSDTPLPSSGDFEGRLKALLLLNLDLELCFYF